MFGFLPAWAGDVMILLAFIAGPTGLIWGILQRKDANRRLVVEEDEGDLNEFDKITTKYKELAEAAERAKKEALDEVANLREDVAELRDGQRELRGLFMEIIEEHHITLTTEQRKRFEATRVRPRRVPRPAQ